MSKVAPEFVCVAPFAPLDVDHWMLHLWTLHLWTLHLWTLHDRTKGLLLLPMTDPAIECVVPSANVCGEGAVWHPQHNAVYWTDINRALLHRYCRASQSFDTWTFDQPVVALALTSDPDRLLAVLGGMILLWSPASDKRENPLFRLQEWPKLRCNEARVDPAGVLWFGTMENNVTEEGTTRPVTEHVGAFFSLRADGILSKWHEGIGIPNTIAWSPSGNSMVTGDTLKNELVHFQYALRTQRISHRGIFNAGFERGLPDGSAMDAEGYLWNCRYGGSCIVRFDVEGEVDRVIETPVKNPTTCAFGDEDLRTLYFTSARDGAGSGPEDGGLFRMRTETPGLLCTPFYLKA
ncbi:MAG TPA: SMP-30/gluconolactonase/LRE family protein [Acidobacteriaceae bacterium]|jgi:sugar lactone lactonase YvrE